MLPPLLELLPEVHRASPENVGEPRSNVLHHALPDAGGAVRDWLPRVG